MIYVKVHEGAIAVCDAELVGKHFEQGKFVLDVSELFYKGELTNSAEVKEILCEGNNLNLVGKKVIALALEENVIREKDILMIDGVPHAQVYFLI